MKILKNDILSKILNGIENCFFYNVGANDGITNDCLYEHIIHKHWKGICVEPGEEAFNTLKNNFKGVSDIFCENCAITDYEGEIILFEGTTSQHFSLCEKYANWMYDVTPKQTTVKCSTSRNILDKYKISKIDVVNIDTAGHESIILQDFPFETFTPKVFIAEFIYVEFAGSHLNDMKSILESKGYNCFYSEDKTSVIGIHKETYDDLTLDDLLTENTPEINLVIPNDLQKFQSVSCEINSESGVGKYITKKADLLNHDGLSSYKQHACQQHHGSFQVFYDFLKQTTPSNILEIGTALGGFTNILKEYIDELNLECNILSYDIHENLWYKDMREKGIDVRVENVFTDNYTDVEQSVKDYIQTSGVTIVLCDGGSKKDEFKILSKYLKVGDFILAHDYGYDQQIFDQFIKNKIWNWCEITEKDIETSCKENNLLDYDRTTFNSVAWVCKVKAY